MSEEMQLALEHTLKTMRELKEAAAEIERLRADLAHADAKGQENDKLLWGTIKANERLRAALENVSSTFDDTYSPYSREGRLGRLARAALAEEAPCSSL